MEIQGILAVKVFTNEDKLDLEVEAGFGSDLMSDVLAFAWGRVVLLIGLTNNHVIYTTAMIDAAAIVFVRGKRPDRALIEAAAGMGLPLLGTRLLMYNSCGRLYQAGYCVFVLRYRVRVLTEEVVELARKLPPSMAKPEGGK